MNLIKTKLLIMMTLISSTTAMACLPMPGSENPLANKLLLTAANKYRINLLNAKVNTQNYSNEIIWKFSNSGIDCHDTNRISAEITFLYKNKWDSRVECVTQVQITLVSSPKEKNGPRIDEYEIIELSSACYAPITDNPPST